MKNLSKSFEVDNCVKAGGVILPESIVHSLRSYKPTFTGDLLTKIEYFNSLTQVTADLILQCDFTYLNDNITTQVNTFFELGGVTIHQTETMTYTYTGDEITKVEVT